MLTGNCFAGKQIPAENRKPGGPQMKIEFQCTFDDYREAGQIRIAKLSVMQRLLIWTMLAASAGCAAWALAAPFHPAPGTPSGTNTTELYLKAPMIPYLPWFMFAIILLIISRSLRQPSRRRFDRHPVAGPLWSSAIFLFLYSAALAASSVAIIDVRQINKTIPWTDYYSSMGWSPWIATLCMAYMAVYPRTLANTRKHSAASAPAVTFEYSADGVTVASDLSTNSYRWAAFYKVIETTNLFVLSATGLGRMIVPKRAFPSSEAFDEFHGLIQEWADGLSMGFPVIQATKC
jgi:hypothetical protein